MDPTQDYEFGTSCYESAEAPRGYLAIQELVKAKRHDMVRALRSPNPQARMHAALVLLEARKKRGKKDKKKEVQPLDAKDKAAIKNSCASDQDPLLRRQPDHLQEAGRSARRVPLR